MQIAVDGPAGAGKSTIAKLIAKEKKITYLDTGAMYRAVTLDVLKNGGDFQDVKKIIELTRKAEISFQGQQVFLNGEDVTEAIRRPVVSRHTSDVAKIPEVRELLVDRQREIAKNVSVIMDGRDIGSVVLPDADYKFYLDASVEERAKRRYDELVEKGTDKSLEDIKKDIERRDYNDMHRDAGPLVCCDDAIVVDTTGMGINDVCRKILSYIKDE